MLLVPRRILMPVILLFCTVGAYSVNNTPFGIRADPGRSALVAFVMEDHGFLVAPAILGVVLGRMMEENFINSMIKANGNAWAFFERPISACLGVATIVILLWPAGAWLWRKAHAVEREP